MDNMVWFKLGGYIEGVEVETLNQYITMYNQTKMWQVSEFIPWLNWELGENFDGFSAIGNYRNPAMNHLIPIHKYEPVEISYEFSF